MLHVKPDIGTPAGVNTIMVTHQNWVYGYTSEQGTRAAVGAAASDGPHVWRRGGIDAARCPGRHRWRPAGRSIRGELKSAAIRQSIVYLTVNLCNDFHRNLRPGFEIVFQRPGPLPVLLIVLQIEQ